MKIIDEKRTYADGHRTTKFALWTDVQPTLEQVTESQVRLGYDPNGYGGPWRMKSIQNLTLWLTTWECSGSCD